MKIIIIIGILSLLFTPKTSAQTTPDIQICGAVNIAELLQFQPNTHDISGETAVRVKLSENIKKKLGSFSWTIGNDKIQLDEPKQEAVLVQAVKPGASFVSYEAFDKNKKSLGKVEIPLQVPQFILVMEYSDYEVIKSALPKGIDTSKARQFDEVLKFAQLFNYKKEILEKSKKLVNDFYKDVNIRFVWAQLGEKMPNFYQHKSIKLAAIQGFARDFNLGSPAANAALGFAPFQNAFITMGRITDRFTIFALNNDSPAFHSFEGIIEFFNDKTVSATRKSMVMPFWKEVFYKIFSWTIAHEIGHTVLPAAYVHTNVAKHGDDIMAAYYDDTDIGLTKKDIIDWRTFPLPGTYKWGKMKGFNKYNTALIQKKLDIQPNPIFDKFFSLEK